MGPTNIALVKLFHADLALKAAQERFDNAAKSVRLIERRVKELSARLQAEQQALMEHKSKADQLDLDLKARDARIEKLRSQQQQAKTNKEYQAYLTEINTEKVDRNKLEDQTIAALEQVERMQGEVKTVQTQLQEDQKKLEEAKAQIGDRLNHLQAEIDQLKPGRDAALEAVPPKVRIIYERVSERHDGEGMAPIQKPDPRNEEYICGSCNMSLVVDMYNRLHTRDDLVHCPNCSRLLFIPDELPPEIAVHKPKETAPKAPKAPKTGKGRGRKKAQAEIGAAPNRQESAADVVNSIAVEADPPAAPQPAPAPTEPTPAPQEQTTPPENA